MLRAAAVALLLCGGLAHASPPGLTPVYAPGPEVLPPGPPPAQPGVQSYRTLTLGVDALAVGMFLVAIDKNSEDLAKLSVVTYLFGAPAIHFSKNRSKHAIASLGLRVGAPLLGAVIGNGLRARNTCETDPYYYDDYCGDDEWGEEAALGMLAGIAAASIIDAAYLAKSDPPKPQPAQMWSPTVRTTQGGFALGMTGRF